MGVVRSAPQCLASVRGSVYVLRYLSEDDQVSSVTHLHKIGSTSRTADARVAGAEKHATFLNAPVEGPAPEQGSPARAQQPPAATQ